MSGAHRDPPGLTHSFPTRRSSDLANIQRSRRQVSQVVPLADREAFVAQDGVGDGDVEVEVRQQDVPDIVPPGHGVVRSGECAVDGPHFASVEVPWSEPSDVRSEEHTSELQSLMRISYAVFCLQ